MNSAEELSFRGLGFLGTLKLGNLIEGLLTRAWLGCGEITSADNLKSRELSYLVAMFSPGDSISIALRQLLLGGRRGSQNIQDQLSS